MVRLGLKEREEEGHSKSAHPSSSCLILPKELPSVEEALKSLVHALKGLEAPNLETSEILRLRSIIQGVKIYKELFADYFDYRGIEVQLVRLSEKYERRAK